MDIPRPSSKSRRLKAYSLGIGSLTLIVVLFALSGNSSAAPSVQRDRLVIDEVVRGELIKAVGGAGRLLPEDQYLIPAPVSGRIEEQVVVAGTAVEAGEVLLVLSNPEVHLQLLEAERALAEAKMASQRLVTENNMTILNAKRELATLRTQLRDAEHQHNALSTLLASGLVAKLEANVADSRWRELKDHMALAEQQMVVTGSAFHAAMRGQIEEIRRVSEVATFHRQRVDSLTVRTAISGLVQDLAVEQGQWVSTGTLLARVFRPGNLKAELRVPETRAGEVAPQQECMITIRGDSIPGTVRRVSPAAEGGTVVVEVELKGELPASARPDLNIEGRIQTGRVADTLHLRRPANAMPHFPSWLYLVNSTNSAERVSIEFGEGSSERIEIVAGATEGDLFVVNNLPSKVGEATHIRILN